MSGHPLTPEPPAELQVEVTGACNLRCRMCLVSYRPPLSKREGALDYETFLALVDGLPALTRLTLQGLGEPLLSPHIFDMVEHAAARDVEVGFNSNATLLTPARSRRLVHAGLGWLHVSLDGATAETYEAIRRGSSFERAHRNLLGLLAARREAGAERPRVILVFVAMRRNVHELPLLVRRAGEWGVDGVWVQNLSHSFSDTDPSGEYQGIREFAEREALWGDGDTEPPPQFAQAREVSEELGVELRLPRTDEAGSAERAPGTPGCTWPWDSAYVTHEGDVQPCCMVMGSDRARLGNLRDQPFQEIWSGERYRRFRAGLLGDDPPGVCRGCSMYKGVF